MHFSNIFLFSKYFQSLLQFFAVSSLCLLVSGDVSHVSRTYLPTTTNALSSSSDNDLISTDTNDLTPPSENNDFDSLDASPFLRHHSNNNHLEQQQPLIPNRPIFQRNEYGAGYYPEYIGILPVKPTIYDGSSGFRNQFYNPAGNRPIYVFNPVPAGAIGAGSVIATDGGYTYGKKK